MDDAWRVEGGVGFGGRPSPYQRARFDYSWHISTRPLFDGLMTRADRSRCHRHLYRDRGSTTTLYWAKQKLAKAQLGPAHLSIILQWSSTGPHEITGDRQTDSLRSVDDVFRCHSLPVKLKSKQMAIMLTWKTWIVSYFIMRQTDSKHITKISSQVLQ